MVSIGHWENLEEAQKLTQSHLVAGIIEEDVRQGGLVPILPLAQFMGQSAKWNRESTNNAAQQFGRGATLNWVESAKVLTIEKELESTYIQTLLDHFVPGIYGTINNYRAIQLMNNKKAMINQIEDLIIYGDKTFSAENLEFDGLHAIAQEFPTNFKGESLDIDMAEAALSLQQLRLLEDRMLHGVDFILCPKAIARRLDAYVQEAGISTNTFGTITFSVNELGRRVTHWNQIPIIRTDYMVGEGANTGQGSEARSKTGSTFFSLFMVKMGQVMEAQPGLTLAWGGEDIGVGELWKTRLFSDLESFDSAGIRMVSYLGLLDGSTVAIGRIFDITDASVVI